MRIRHYGLLAPGHVGGRLEHARQLLQPSPDRDDTGSESSAEAAISELTVEQSSDYRQLYYELTGSDLRRCPVCHMGTLRPEALPRSAPRPP